MKSLTITIVFFLLCNSLFAQPIYEKNGYWGVEYGANINYPLEKSYLLGLPGFYSAAGKIPPSVINITLYPTISNYFGVSRLFRIYSINESSSLFLQKGLSYSQIQYKYSYQLNNYDFEQNHEIFTEKINYNAVAINSQIKHVISINKKNAVFYATNVEFAFYNDFFAYDKWRSRWHFKNSFNLGYSYKMNKCIISFQFSYNLYALNNKIHYYKSWFNFQKRYNNVKAGVMLNF